MQRPTRNGGFVAVFGNNVDCFSFDLYFERATFCGRIYFRMFSVFVHSFMFTHSKSPTLEVLLVSLKWCALGGFSSCVRFVYVVECF